MGRSFCVGCMNTPYWLSERDSVGKDIIHCPDFEFLAYTLNPRNGDLLRCCFEGLLAPTNRITLTDTSSLQAQDQCLYQPVAEYYRQERPY